MLTKNQISEIVETPLAKHIVIINNVYPETQKTIEQVRKEISNTLLDVEVGSYILDLKNKIKINLFFDVKKGNQGCSRHDVSSVSASQFLLRTRVPKPSSSKHQIVNNMTDSTPHFPNNS